MSGIDVWSQHHKSHDHLLSFKQMPPPPDSLGSLYLYSLNSVPSEQHMQLQCHAGRKTVLYLVFMQYLYLVESGFLRSTCQQKLDKSILYFVPVYLFWGYTKFFYSIGKMTWKFTLNIWQCLSLVLMSISFNFLKYWHSYLNSGNCGLLWFCFNLCT